MPQSFAGAAGHGMRARGGKAVCSHAQSSAGLPCIWRRMRSVAASTLSAFEERDMKPFLGIWFICAALFGAARASDTTPAKPARAVLIPENNRKPAPPFELEDSSGRVVKLSDYRGKVVLLDFWATWCGGCKHEMPWFSQFDKKYRSTGLAVIGISLDDGGWAVVKPFIAKTRLRYSMLLGNDSVARQYGIASMPDTFLIDGQGRIAAPYSGVVDKDDIETNAKTMLSQSRKHRGLRH